MFLAVFDIFLKDNLAAFPEKPLDGGGNPKAFDIAAESEAEIVNRCDNLPHFQDSDDMVFTSIMY